MALSNSRPGTPTRKSSNPFLVAGLEEIRAQQTQAAQSSPVLARRLQFEADSPQPTSFRNAPQSPSLISINLTKGHPHSPGPASPRSFRVAESLGEPRVAAISQESAQTQNSAPSSPRRGASALLRLLEKVTPRVSVQIPPEPEAPSIEPAILADAAVPVFGPDAPPPPPPDSSDEDSSPPPPPPDSDSESSSEDPVIPDFPSREQLERELAGSAYISAPAAANGAADHPLSDSEGEEPEPAGPRSPTSLQLDLSKARPSLAKPSARDESSDEDVVMVSVARSVKAESSEDDEEAPSVSTHKSAPDHLRRKPSTGILIKSPSGKLDLSPKTIRRIPPSPVAHRALSVSESYSQSENGAAEDNEPPPPLSPVEIPSTSDSPGTSSSILAPKDNPFPQIPTRTTDADALVLPDNEVEMEELIVPALIPEEITIVMPSFKESPPPTYRPSGVLSRSETGNSTDEDIPETPQGRLEKEQNDTAIKREILDLGLPEELIEDVMGMTPEARANWFRSLDAVRDFPEPPPLQSYSPHPARHMIRTKVEIPSRPVDDYDDATASEHRESVKAPREFVFDPTSPDTPESQRRHPTGPNSKPSALELGTRVTNSLGTTDVRMFGPVRATRGMFMSKEFKRYTNLRNKEKSSFRVLSALILTLNLNCSF